MTLEIKIKDSFITGGDWQRRKKSEGQSVEIHPCNSVVLYTWQQNLITCNCPLSCKSHFLSPVHLEKNEKIMTLIKMQY